MARRSDKANYVALVVVGIALFLIGSASSTPMAMALGVVALIGAGFYYWKIEKAAERGA